jgi:hypothetical protein
MNDIVLLSYKLKNAERNEAEKFIVKKVHFAEIFQKFIDFYGKLRNF